MKKVIAECKNDIGKKKTDASEQIKTCDCQASMIVNKSDSITNPITVYALKCNRCKVIYIGHSGKDVCDRYKKPKYDIKNGQTRMN